jgi:hypothetical protein
MRCDCCGICCVAVSINSSQLVKPAGQRCPHLTTDNRCGVWGNPDLQPEVCRSIRPMPDLCRFDLRGKPNGTRYHYRHLTRMERATRPRKETPCPGR